MITAFKHRLLRKNHSRAIPSHCLYLDIETEWERVGRIEEHYLKLAWTCSVRYNQAVEPQKESWRLWKRTYPLNKYIASQAYSDVPLHIFGHNVFFDLQASDFFHYFTLWGWVLDFYYEKGLTYILVIKKKKRVIRVYSTTNWFPVSLEKLGGLVKLKKGKVDFASVSDSELATYCKRDVEITKKVMEYWFTFIQKHDMGKFSPTRASQAFRAYRHRFMDTSIYLHDSDEVKALEREAYFGGRQECYRLGEIKGGPFITLDINSMYPFVMTYTKVPIRLISYREGMEVSHVVDTLKRFAVVAEILVNTETPLYPMRQEGKVIFPVGQFITYVCTEGMKEALTRGHIKEIRRIAIYEKATIFTEYVQYLYDLRAQYRKRRNEIMAECCKYLLNSLYGKFGQRKPNIHCKEDVTYDGYYRMEVLILPEHKTGIEYKMFNTFVWQVGEDEGPNSFAAISAHVTESARMLLWRIMEEIGPDRVLYCDTDSIKLRKKHLSLVKYPIHKDKLGSLKIEDQCKKLVIFGAKSYITEKERKIKGVPHTAEEIRRYTYKYQTFLKQATHMERMAIRRYLVRDTVKVAEPFYDKGLVVKGTKVYPFRFSRP